MPDCGSKDEEYSAFSLVRLKDYLMQKLAYVLKLGKKLLPKETLFCFDVLC